MNNLSKHAKFMRLSGPISAATTDVTNMTSVDMKGYRSCTLMVACNAITTGAVTSVKAQQSSDDGSTDAYSDLAGSSVTIADTADNTLVLLEVTEPRKRYLNFVIDRGTQNASFDGVYAILTGPQNEPVTQSTTHVTISELHASPAEGTA